MSPSAYYAWLTRPESRRVREDRRLLVEIKAIHKASRKTYGSPRIHAELKANGLHHGKKRVSRLMHDNDIRAKQKKKFKATTDSKHSHPVAPNLIQRKFQVDRPNESWLADITYIPTREGWLYLAAILDLYSRGVVGWSMARRMNKQLVLDALEMAVDRLHPEPGLIHHSGRGSQYACADYQRALSSHGMVCTQRRLPGQRGHGKLFSQAQDGADLSPGLLGIKPRLISSSTSRFSTTAAEDILPWAICRPGNMR